MVAKFWRAVAATAAALLTTGGVVAVEARADTTATTFVVNSDGDAADLKADGVCRTATAGECTLRAAISEASKATGPALITFAIPGAGVHTIQLQSRLPQVSNPAGITIDGYTQPGSSVNTQTWGSNAKLMIQIAGQGAGAFNSFYVTGPYNTFRGLSVYNTRIAFYAPGTGVTHNAWVGNFICTDSTGTAGAGGVNAGGGGILLDTGPTYNSIGVPDSYDASTAANVADRNVISGCAHRGVIISNGTTDHNRVYNNLVGLRPDNSGPNGNYSHGIDINYNAQDNTVGGLLPNQANVVSGNVQEGIEVSHGPFNRRNNVIGNFVGTDATGTTAPAWAGNGMMGIRMEGEKECAPCELNSGYHEVAYNVVVGNQGGMQIDKNTQWDNIHDNLVGVLPDGTPAGNALFAVRLEQGAFHHRFYHNTFANNAAGIQVQATASQPPNPYVIPPLDNTFTQNSIYNNGGLGIDLAPYNNANVNGVGDPNVANGIQAPVIRSIVPTAVTVSTCAGCTVELFDTGKTPGNYKGLSAFGQGKTYLASAVAGSNGTAVVDMTATPVRGSSVLAATTTDPDGNTSEFSRAVAFIGATAPVISPLTAVTYGNQHTYTISGTGTQGDVVNLSLSDGTQNVTGTSVVDENLNWTDTIDVSTLADGPLTLTAYSVNTAGATSSDVTTSTSKRTLPLTPTFSTAGPATASNVTAVPVAGGGDPNVTVAVTLSDGVTTMTASATAGPTGAWSTTINSSALSDGTLSVTAIASDVSGSSKPATTSLVKRTTATTPTISSAGPADVGNRTATPISGTGGPDDTVTLVVTDGTKSVTGTTVVDRTGAWATTVDVSTLADGTLTVTASARNAAGSTSGSTSTTFAKLTATPRPTVNAPASVDGTTVAAVGVNGTATPYSAISLTATDAGGATVTGTTNTTAGGNWTTTLDLRSLADGTVTVAAVANDGTNGPSVAATTTTSKLALASAPQVLTTTATGTSITQTFSAPTSTRGVPLTGYVATVQKVAGGPVTTTTLPASATTVTLSGLSGSTPYVVTLRATTSAGSGAAATTNVSTKIRTAITVAVSTTTVKAGSSLVISGVLTNLDTGAVMPNKQVNVVFFSGTTSNRIPAKIVTDANGRYSLTYVPTKSGQYQGVFKGDATSAAANSVKSPLVTVN